MKIPEDQIRNIGQSSRVVENALAMMRKNEQYERGNANILHECLLAEIAVFEKALTGDEEIGGYLAAFGKEIYIRIDSIDFRNPFLIIFHGTNISDGNRLTLAQHVTQINVLFCAVKVETGKTARRIGFLS